MKDQTTPSDTQSDLQARILEAFAFRHATKVFDASRKIPDDQFETILEAGRLSPSSFGFEPWQILVVQSPEKRAALHPHAWGANGKFNGTEGQLNTASHFVLFLAHRSSTMAHDASYLRDHLLNVKKFPEDMLEGYLGAYGQFQKEHFHITTDRQMTDWSGKQAYIALGNMMTVAAMLGIDSCPIEGFDQGAVSAVLERDFGIDPTVYQPAVMAGFGYRSGDPMFPQTRRSTEQAISWV